MKFKLGLVAGVMSLATLFATGASAASLSSAGATYSLEGLNAAAAGNVNLPNFAAILASDLLVNDTIVVTVAGPALNAGLVPTLTCQGTAGLAVGFVNQAGNVLTFRVTGRTGGAGTTSVGDTCTSGGLATTYAKLAAGSSASVTWTVTAAISNLSIDQLCATADNPVAGGGAEGVAAACVSPAVANFAKLADVKSQFAAAVTKALNGVVDVNASRVSFAAPFSGGNTALLDNLTVSLSNQDNTTAGFLGAWTLPVVSSKVSMDVTGDFSNMDANADNCATAPVATYTNGGGTLSAARVIAGSCSTATVTFASPGAPGLLAGIASTVGLKQPGLAGDLVLVAPQTFAGDVVWSFPAGAGTATKTTITIAPGAWTLNGFQARVGYMPYGATISRIIYIGNNSSQAGTASITGRNTAGVACNATLGPVAKNAVTVLSTLIDNALSTCYGAGFTDKVDFTLTATIPQAAGYLYAAYNVAGTNRLTVVNKSNVQ